MTSIPPRPPNCLLSALRQIQVRAVAASAFLPTPEVGFGFRGRYLGRPFDYCWLVKSRCILFCRTSKLSRDYAWRGACAAGSVTSIVVGCSAWLGSLGFCFLFCYDLAPLFDADLSINQSPNAIDVIRVVMISEIIQNNRGWPIWINGIRLNKKQGLSLGLFLVNQALSKPVGMSCSSAIPSFSDSSSTSGMPAASRSRKVRQRRAKARE